MPQDGPTVKWSMQLGGHPLEQAYVSGGASQRREGGEAGEGGSRRPRDLGGRRGKGGAVRAVGEREGGGIGDGEVEAAAGDALGGGMAGEAGCEQGGSGDGAFGDVWGRAARTTAGSWVRGVPGQSEASARRSGVPRWGTEPA